MIDQLSVTNIGHIHSDANASIYTCNNNNSSSSSSSNGIITHPIIAGVLSNPTHTINNHDDMNIIAKGAAR